MSDGERQDWTAPGQEVTLPLEAEAHVNMALDYLDPPADVAAAREELLWAQDVFKKARKRQAPAERNPPPR